MREKRVRQQAMELKEERQVEMEVRAVAVIRDNRVMRVEQENQVEHRDLAAAEEGSCLLKPITSSYGHKHH
jgi:hypothetical protein